MASLWPRPASVLISSSRRAKRGLRSLAATEGVAAAPRPGPREIGRFAPRNDDRVRLDGAVGFDAVGFHSVLLCRRGDNFLKQARNQLIFPHRMPAGDLFLPAVAAKSFIVRVLSLATVIQVVPPGCGG